MMHLEDQENLEIGEKESFCDVFQVVILKNWLYRGRVKLVTVDNYGICEVR